MSDSIALLIEGYTAKPKSSRIMQAHAVAVLEKAIADGLLAKDGLATLVISWSRKYNVSVAELASFVFREGANRKMFESSEDRT